LLPNPSQNPQGSSAWLSYTNPTGYVWFMAKLREELRLRPRSSRSILLATPPGLRPPPRRTRRAASERGNARWQGRFLKGLAQGGMTAALAQSGKDIGDAILACLMNPQFRQQVERTSDERLATAERLLVDLLLSRVRAEKDGDEKAMLSIWQVLKDEKRRPAAQPAAPKSPQRKPRNSISPERAEAAERSAERAEVFQRILDVVRERLETAEARAAGGAGDQGSSISSSRTRS
jgi:hypothetical protein